MKIISSYIAAFCFFCFGLSYGQTENEIHIMIDNKEYAKALEACNFALVSNAQLADLYISKSQALIGLGRVEDGVNAISEGIKIMPDSVELYIVRASYFEACHLFTEAYTDFIKASEKQDNKREKSISLSNAGGALYNLQEFERAVEILGKALELDSTNKNAINNLSIVLDMVGEQELALTYLEKIIQLDTLFAYAHANKGFLLQKMGRDKEAIRCFDKALVLTYQSDLELCGIAYSNRSYSKFKTGDTKGAMKDIEKALELMPSNSWAYKNKAIFLIKQKKKKAACEELEKALRLGFTAQYGNEVEDLKKANCAGK